MSVYSRQSQSTFTWQCKVYPWLFHRLKMWYIQYIVCVSYIGHIPAPLIQLTLVSHKWLKLSVCITLIRSWQVSPLHVHGNELHTVVPSTVQYNHTPGELHLTNHCGYLCDSPVCVSTGIKPRYNIRSCEWKSFTSSKYTSDLTVQDYSILGLGRAYCTAQYKIGRLGDTVMD